MSVGGTARSENERKEKITYHVRRVNVAHTRLHRALSLIESPNC